MSFNFPSSPALNDQYAPVGGPTYTWDGIAWKAVVQGVPVTVYVSDTAPPQPALGQLWWDSDSGTMAIWYADADSAQWVQVSGAVSAVPAEPKLLAVRKVTANNTPLIFTEFDLTKYKTYQFYFENLIFTNTGTTGTEFGFQMSSDGGATWLNAANSYNNGRMVLVLAASSTSTPVGNAFTHAILANNFNNNFAMCGDMLCTVGHYFRASSRVMAMASSAVHLAQYASINGPATFANPLAIRFFFIDAAVFLTWNTLADVDGRILMYGMPR